jgi:Na+-transporting methylmalonyl-CoA/oxaloacetate decarboxylase gamma subunit
MKKQLIMALVVLAGCLSMNAQSRSGLKINEVMVVNDSSMVDDFGQHSAWIELFNSTHAAMEIRSVYITTDPDSTPLADMKIASRRNMVYPVPMGDVLTKIPKRQHILFWADGEPTRGTFHTPLRLDPTKPNWIGIYDANGLTLLDSVTVPVLAPNQSYARKIDGVADPSKFDDGQVWEVRDGQGEKYITPSSNNKIKELNNKVETFKEQDPHGFAMAAMAMCIVFCALLVLCLCFWFISKAGSKVSRLNKMRAQGIQSPESVKLKDRPESDSGEAIAAIAMALHEHLDAHDTETTILTINKVKKSYSPWSSKIYSMREVPNRK